MADSAANRDRKNSARSTRLQLVASCGVYLALAIGLLVLACWPFKINLIISPNHTTMVFNTALSLFCAALGLIQINRQRWQWALVLGLLTAALGLATFSQYLTDANLGLDELFIRDTLSPAAAPPGRMAPNTSLSFGIAGIAIFLSALVAQLAKPAALIRLVTLLGVSILGVGLIALTGHLTGLVSAYGWTSHAQMAPHTATGLILIGLALTAQFAPPSRPLAAYQQWQMSWSIPAVVLICLYALIIINVEQNRNAELNLSNKADNLAATIFSRLDEVEAAQMRMVQRINNNQISPQQWRTDAYTYLRDMPSLVALAEFDSQGKLISAVNRETLNRQWLKQVPRHLNTGTGGYSQLADGQLLKLTKLQSPNTDIRWLASLVSLKKLLDSLSRLENDRNYSLSIALDNAVPQQLPAPAAPALSDLHIKRHYKRGADQWQLQLTASQHYLNSFRGPLQLTITGLLILLGAMAIVMQRFYFNIARQEGELDETYQRQRAAMDAMLDGVIVIDNRGQIMSLNRSAQELFGYEAEALIAQNISCLMPEPYRSQHDSYLQHYAQTGEKRFIGQKRIMRAQKADGSEFPILLQITESNSNGKQFFTGVVHDLSEMIATQAQLSEKEAVLTAAIKNSPVGFCLEDLQGRIIEANQAIADWLGYSPAEMINLSAEDMLAEKFHQSYSEDFAQLRTGQLDQLTREQLYKRKDGELVWGLLSASVIKNQAQQIIFIAVQIIDIHQAKTMALLLEERNQALERSNSELDQFAYVASHDLKAPLNAIDKLASWIEEDCGELLPEPAKPHLHLLKGRVQRMSKLLDDLLIYSRVGRVAYEATDINLREMALDIFELQGVGNAFTLSVPEIDIALPRTPLELVLRNLIANAVKHHHRDQGKISIGCTIEPQAYSLSLCDDGPGIPPHLQAKAMQMFQTLKPRDEREGSGMGLALCKKIVDFYRGNIRIESDGVSGTCIHIHWPRLPRAGSLNPASNSNLNSSQGIANAK